MHSGLVPAYDPRVAVLKGVATSVGVRVPPGAWWQLVNGTPGPVNVEYLWGSKRSGVFLTVPGTSISAIMLNPGQDVDVLLTGTLNTEVFLLAADASGHWGETPQAAKLFALLNPPAHE